MRLVAVSAVVAVVVVLSAPAQASDASVRHTFSAGLLVVQRYHRDQLEPRLVRTIAALRSQHASTPCGRAGRALALDGFGAALQAVRAELEFYNEDSGRLAEATKDAARAGRQWKRSAGLLRAAGNALGVRVGSVNGR
ncbi:MAG: hypothetical protein ACXWYS_01035 [Gaiellaceae bacterium]